MFAGDARQYQALFVLDLVRVDFSPTLPTYVVLLEPESRDLCVAQAVELSLKQINFGYSCYQESETTGQGLT